MELKSQYDSTLYRLDLFGSGKKNKNKNVTDLWSVCLCGGGRER